MQDHSNKNPDSDTVLPEQVEHVQAGSQGGTHPVYEEAVNLWLVAVSTVELHDLRVIDEFVFIVICVPLCLITILTILHGQKNLFRHSATAGSASQRRKVLSDARHSDGSWCCCLK